MGKKHRRSQAYAMPATPPATPHDMMRYSAESMARTAIENHPSMKKARDMITSEVMAATERALKKSMKKS